MRLWGNRRAALVLSAALIGGFGLLLGVLILAFEEPRQEGGPMTGGSAGGMAGMAMPSVTAGAGGGRAGELAAAHADVEAGRFAQAVSAYERVLREDMHSVEVLTHLGMALGGVGEVDRGLGYVDRALAMDPDNLHALWVKAVTLFEAKAQYAESIPVWERVLALVPESTTDAATARGYVLRARERLGGPQRPAPGKGSP